mgnify:CR=1 FL=1
MVLLHTTGARSGQERVSPLVYQDLGCRVLARTGWDVERDGLATAMHGTWGAFWLGYGLYLLLVALGGQLHALRFQPLRLFLPLGDLA